MLQNCTLSAMYAGLHRFSDSQSSSPCSAPKLHWEFHARVQLNLQMHHVCGHRAGRNSFAARRQPLQQGPGRKDCGHDSRQHGGETDEGEGQGDQFRLSEHEGRQSGPRVLRP